MLRMWGGYYSQAKTEEAQAKTALSACSGDQLLVAGMVWQQAFEELRQWGIMCQILTGSRPLN